MSRWVSVILTVFVLSAISTTMAWDKIHEGIFTNNIALRGEVETLKRELDYWIKEKDIKQENIDLLHASLQTCAPKVNLKVTAYSNDPISINNPKWRDGLTATGVKAAKGIVAADWTIFPPGTILYIPGYGEAIVYDRGSAVKGYHIDVFLPSRKEALKWGVKTTDAYVIKAVQQEM
ncbi:MAG: 3D domain-containing protein [Candidatus Peribacteraceae bacterium]|nr:3D domain-containing protein [Candidatus Peribacteraceae bacterium]